MSDIKDRLKFESGTDKVTQSAAMGSQKSLTLVKHQNLVLNNNRTYGISLQDKPEVAESFTRRT